jgi:hypothetical protein
VRTFRRNSAASFSFVRNSERSGSEFDMLITYASYRAHRLTSADTPTAEKARLTRRDIHPAPSRTLTVCAGDEHSG